MSQNSATTISSR